MDILGEPGIVCFNRDAAEVFSGAGAEVIAGREGSVPCWTLRIPERLILDTIETAPKAVKLGARDEENSLLLDGMEPRVRFASGSEANNWLDVGAESLVSRADPTLEVEVPSFCIGKGTVERLATAAHLCEHLDSWDAFLRPVNIQDDDISDANKDVNKFFASLNNTTKHVMAGLTELGQLDSVVRMARIIAGGEEALRDNPIISFIASVTKSPLQLVDDTTQKAMEVARRGIPLVISSAPQGGTTAPILEAGIVAQVNAEILAGVSLAQLVNRATPVIYGSVPGRANMTDLNDSYGVPEFGHYNVDCVQMARYYGLPCYSSGGVSDARFPGIQASVERLFSILQVALAGPQYLHYSFGLLERTNTFCPVQAVLDAAHIDTMKRHMQSPDLTDDAVAESLRQIRRVMGSPQRLFTRFARGAMRSGSIAPQYPFESRDMTDRTLLHASERMRSILSLPRHCIAPQTVDEVFRQTPGLLARLRNL